MPLHVAAKANQLLQAELLITYGADPACPDAQGKTAIDYARYLWHFYKAGTYLLLSLYEINQATGESGVSKQAGGTPVRSNRQVQLLLMSSEA